MREDVIRPQWKIPIAVSAGRVRLAIQVAIGKKQEPQRALRPPFPRPARYIGAKAGSACSRLIEKADRVADGDDRFRRIVRDFDPKFFFEGHDQFDRVERIGPKIFNEIGIVDDLVGVDAEMLHYNLPYPLGDIAHGRLILVPYCLLTPADIKSASKNKAFES
jgi:hypothetical protein